MSMDFGDSRLDSRLDFGDSHLDYLGQLFKDCLINFSLTDDNLCHLNLIKHVNTTCCLVFVGLFIL